MKDRSKVVVFGASGYSGLELLRWLSGHPGVEVIGASSNRWSKALVSDRVPGWSSPLRFESHDAVEKKAGDAEVALLATPADVSLALAPKLLDKDVRVIDLSGAFRLEDGAQYTKWYGIKHYRTDLLREASYGLPELFAVRGGEEPRLVANPGCYATAAILAVGPLFAAGLVDPSSPVILDGKSGTTGAGRKSDERMSFSEVAESIRPYRLGEHQHTPEIERALKRLGRFAAKVSFTAHLIPIRRGLVVSGYMVGRDNITQKVIDEAYDVAYGEKPFVRVLQKHAPEPGPLTHTNFCDVHARFDERTGTLLAFGAIDNLVKGAAGQAIQNLNTMLGLSPTAGLLHSAEDQL